MKRILTSILFVLPLSVVAHEGPGSDSHLLRTSPVTAAVAAALEMFEESSAGTPIAFHAQGKEASSKMKVSYVDSHQILRSIGYDCDLHSSDDHFESHCTATELTHTDSVNLVPQFDVDEFLASLEMSADIFSRKVAPLQSLTQVKMWQSGDLIWATLTYVKESVEGKSHYMCHVHGENFDCHRSRNPGPDEPPVWE